MTAVSTSVARDYTEFLTLTDPVTVIENGIPIVPRRPDLGKAVRCELGLADDVFLFVAVGNVKPEKGFGDLVVAADLLRRASLPRPFAVAIAGGPDDAQCLSDLQSLITRLRLEPTVRLLGQREDTLAIYSAADAFVLSSRSEGLPLVLLEAMSVGLPVVATAVGGVPDVLRYSGGGILVEPASPPALAEGMARLVTGPELCADLGARGIEAVKRRYSAQVMAMNYLAFFERVVHGDDAPAAVEHGP
jgi:glycosyltransferase involved in cell wall biosynthesis